MFCMRKKISGFFAGKDIAAALSASETESGWTISGLSIAHVLEAGGFSESAGRAATEAGIRKGNVSLSIPDVLARTVLLDFEQFPERRDEADALVRLKAARQLDLDLGAAVFRWQMLPLNNGDKGGVKALAVAVQRNVVAAYEDGLLSKGYNASRINIHALSLVNLLLDNGGGRQTGAFFAVILIEEDFFAVAMVRGGALDYYRCKEASAESRLKDIQASFISYRGSGGGLPDRVYLFDGMGGYAERLVSGLGLDIIEPGADAFFTKGDLDFSASDRLAAFTILGSGI